jgi:hypothetical protein
MPNPPREDDITPPDFTPKWKPSPPQLTPKPQLVNVAVARHEHSGIWKPVTGNTRNFVKWGAIFTAVSTLLHPLIQAVAERIAPSPERELIRALLKEQHEKGH